ncbi:ABC transporter ATP-binding protein [Chryseolinea lacunae]|uniref:ABC transporter ATP-binding protein n=1 Tax=Chryseolinea lacunae TaxID=2801331 RepID=A0ABS1KZX8_9BACT|nr:ABC transporter ATP-binding protein [Chryseolinea lacunae]MBL0744984.1 ABC transporter ATP-binding protein [Chryseolinea lacunae]
MIQVSKLVYRYTPATAIAFPDFTVQKGEHFLLLGDSGSGKTTLLHLAGGLLRQYEGSVVVDGTELSTLSETALDHFRGKKIGFVFQRNHLISALSVEQNLMLSPYLAELPLDHAHITEVLDALGLENKRNSRVTTLSQGQAQRVAIARAVLNKPSIIFADEPTSALDDKNCDRVVSLLLDAARLHGSTLIVATHDQRLKSKLQHQIRLTAAHEPA